ncbi:hypothetical protein [Thalassotalea sp. SU-HH00458]|uniref:hypothetical protein n=1 Tax=Thalassotalea sp. SU-HH00458 TaxID=3127657 RepID=UPI00310753CA
MKSENSFKWIKNNRVQLEWLNTYLQARISGFKWINFKDTNDDVVNVVVHQIKESMSGDTLELFNIKARAAWNQHTRRLKRKNTHVTSSFEIEKNIYKEIVRVAKKHNIPITLAVEELLKKGCELAKDADNLDKRKLITNSLRKNVIKKNKLISDIFNDSPSKQISKESLIEAFSEEAYERHILELEYISLDGKKSENELKVAQDEEVKRYNNLCNNLNLLNLIIMD